jgi:hypothetical protein
MGDDLLRGSIVFEWRGMEVYLKGPILGGGVYLKGSIQKRSIRRGAISREFHSGWSIQKGYIQERCLFEHWFIRGVLVSLGLYFSIFIFEGRGVGAWNIRRRLI